MDSKRGFSTIMLVFFIFTAFFLIIILGSFFFGFQLFNDTASGINVTLGTQNFAEEYQKTVGRGFNAILSAIITSSVALLLGMVLMMLLVSYKFRSDNFILIPLDLFIVVAAFITAVYISTAFDSFINANSIFIDVFTINLQVASKFVLNLPIIVTITGALIMLVHYLPLKRREPNVLQFN